MSTPSHVLPAPEAGREQTEFLVIHPLDDQLEEKVRSDHLPPLAMTLSVRVSLFTLRGYLLLMMLLLLYHVIDLAGLIAHHIK
jgi:hypothetical protein